VLVFIAMCLCASGTYIVNDLLDLSADRRHAHKRHRPFAAGDLPLEFGLVLAPLLVCAGLVIGVGLSLSCFAVLGIYILTTLAYSLYLKSRMLVDVFTLAGLYTIRIIAGHVAGDIIFSAWLLGFSIFLFLSLALVKRVSELHNLRLSNREKPEGRGYLNADLEMLQQLGLISGGLAVLILALYVNSPAETLLYKHPLPLLALCPILFYWIARLWLITHRGNMQSDPVLFALKDRVSYYLLVAAAIIVVCSARF
jgi:4-hydroxybenzoate polyprenyltransferase